MSRSIFHLMKFTSQLAGSCNHCSTITPFFMSHIRRAHGSWANLLVRCLKGNRTAKEMVVRFLDAKFQAFKFWFSMWRFRDKVPLNWSSGEIWHVIFQRIPTVFSHPGRTNAGPVSLLNVMFFINPIGSMGRTVYLPTLIPSKINHSPG